MTMGVSFVKGEAFLGLVGLAPCARHLERKRRKIGPCHLELMSYAAGHMGLPKIVIGGVCQVAHDK